MCSLIPFSFGRDLGDGAGCGLRYVLAASRQVVVDGISLEEQWQVVEGPSAVPVRSREVT